MDSPLWMFNGFLLLLFLAEVSTFIDADQTANDADEVCSLEGLEEFTLPILQGTKDRPSLNLRLLQQPTFDFVEENSSQGDDTGMVVWGASVCLGRYLANVVLPPIMQTQTTTTILELGCGSAIPSLVSCAYANQRTNKHEMKIIASDQEERTLQNLQAIAKMNNCSQLEVDQIHWTKSGPQSTTLPPDFRADIIVASEVIYSHETVPLLVKTINGYLAHHSHARVYVALRATRPGANPFRREAMANAGFVRTEVLPCEPYQEGYFDGKGTAADKSLPMYLPPGFRNAGGMNRWRGQHRIYVFERKDSVAKNR